MLDSRRLSRPSSASAPLGGLNRSWQRIRVRARLADYEMIETRADLDTLAEDLLTE